MNLVGNGTFGRIEGVSGSIAISNARRYYITDMLGSTRAVFDDNGTLQETFDYYPFGLIMPKRGTTSDNTMEKFTGHEYDEHSGLELYYAGARYFDAAIGQFTSVDPLADQFPAWSPYNYGMNNPNRFTDPTGMASREIMSFGNANYDNSFTSLEERREARDKFREFKNIQDEEDDDRKSCVGLSCKNKDNSTDESISSDTYYGLSLGAGATSAIADQYSKYLGTRYESVYRTIRSRLLPSARVIESSMDYLKIGSRFAGYAAIASTAFGVVIDSHNPNVSATRTSYRATVGLVSSVVGFSHPLFGVGIAYGDYGLEVGYDLGVTIFNEFTKGLADTKNALHNRWAPTYNGWYHY